MYRRFLLFNATAATLVSFICHAHTRATTTRVLSNRRIAENESAETRLIFLHLISLLSLDASSFTSSLATGPRALLIKRIVMIERRGSSVKYVLYVYSRKWAVPFFSRDLIYCETETMKGECNWSNGWSLKWNFSKHVLFTVLSGSVFTAICIYLWLYF